MTVLEAVQLIQKQKPGPVNRTSVRYAQTLLREDETVIAAAIANIYTKRSNYPGVVVLTDQNVMAVCGLPGAKRKTIIPIEELEKCEEVSTVLQYKATFRSHQDAFSMSIDPDDGEVFSAYVAEINGEEFEQIQLKADGKILNPNLLRSRRRNQLRKERQKARSIRMDAERQKKLRNNLTLTNKYLHSPIDAGGLSRKILFRPRWFCGDVIFSKATLSPHKSQICEG